MVFWCHCFLFLVDCELIVCYGISRRTPYVTGTSVLGVTYKDGVMIAADTLGKNEPDSAFSCSRVE